MCILVPTSKLAVHWEWGEGRERGRGGDRLVKDRGSRGIKRVENIKGEGQRGKNTFRKT